MSSVWDWVYDFTRRAKQNGDRQRVALDEICDTGLALQRKSPDQAIAQFERGQALAKQLGEPWWIMLYEHLILITLFSYKRDFPTALQRGMRAVVEVRKPTYNGLPQRVCLQDDLLTIYGGIDPVGYASAIATTLDYMGQVVDRRLACFQCHLAQRVNFELDLGHCEVARHYALLLLEQPGTSGSSPGDANRLASRTAYLCRIAHVAGDWAEVLHWSEAGLASAERANSRYSIAELYAWRAAALRWRGDPSAHNVYLRAIEEAKQLPDMSTSYFDAVSAYLELSGELDQAIMVRRRHVEATVQSGELFEECKARLAGCRLLVQLGRPNQEELSAARAAAAKLRRPEEFLRQLDNLEKGVP